MKKAYIAALALSAVFITTACGKAPVEVEDITIDEPVIEAVVENAAPVKEYLDIPLSEDLQDFIIARCEDYGIEPIYVFAMIERESGFKVDAIGDSGKSFGLMQIKKEYHEERMKRLGVTDLLDPYSNVAVGIDYLAEMIEKYTDIEMALAAYNAGSGGAYRNYFRNGIFSTEYSRGVLERAEELAR